MPTVFTHSAVPMVLGAGLGKKIIPYPLLFLGILLSILPDFDVAAFKLGIPYADAFGHRGFSHSLFLSGMFAAVFSAGFRYFKIPWVTGFLFLFAAGASHGLLDTLTNGGLGIALFWPFSDARFFAPAQVIQVSPLNPTRFLSGNSLSQKALTVMRSEILWVWLPCSGLYLCLLLTRLKSNLFRPSALS